MALNLDSLNSIDEDIANIIPSPKNDKSRELIIDEESKLGKVEKEIDSFGDISGINNNENNDILSDNSILMTKEKIQKSILPKSKNKMQNLEFKIKNFFENSKINNLTPSITRNAEYRYNPKQSLYENSKQNINNKFKNKFDVKSIRISNEERYKLLFDKNKKLDINSLREEYFKLKKDDKTNLVNNCKNPPIENNKGKKFISIFNVDYDYDKINNRKKLQNNSQKKMDYNFKNYYKTNINSKEKGKEKEKKIKEKHKQREFNGLSKFNFLKSKLFNEKPSSSLFNINFYCNLSQNKNSKNSKNNRNSIFSSLRNLNNSTNSKEDNDSWIISSNNNKKIKNPKFNYNNIYNSSKNNKKNFKSTLIFEKLNSNRNNKISKDFNFKFINPKTSLMDYKDINTINQNKIRLIHRYNNNNNDYYYNLTNEEKNNSNLESIKNNKLPYTKLTENNNNNLLDKFSDNFDAIFNFVESKIKQKPINKINSHLKNNNLYNGINNCKYNFKKVNQQVSISQNVAKRNNLYKLCNKNNNNKFKLPINNKLKIIINEEISPFKRYISKENYQNNFSISNYSYNDLDYSKLQNKKKNLLLLL